MTKKNTIFKTLLLTLLLFLMCSSCFMLTACGDEEKDNQTVYSLYQYQEDNDVHTVGENFYGFTLSSQFVQVILSDNNTAVLKISVGFLEGESEYINTYQTYTGTYTETATEILFVFPEDSIRATKSGNYLIIPLGYDELVILQK